MSGKYKKNVDNSALVRNYWSNNNGHIKTISSKHCTTTLTALLMVLEWLIANRNSLSSYSQSSSFLMNKYARRESFIGICPTHGDLYEQARQRAFLPNNWGQTKNQIRLKTIL